MTPYTSHFPRISEGGKAFLGQTYFLNLLNPFWKCVLLTPCTSLAAVPKSSCRASHWELNKALLRDRLLVQQFSSEIKIKVQKVSTCAAKVEDALKFCGWPGVEIWVLWMTLGRVCFPRLWSSQGQQLLLLWGKESFLSTATFATSAEVLKSLCKVRRNGVVRVLLPLKVQNCFSRFSGTYSSLIASNKNWGATATSEDEALRQAFCLLIMKSKSLLKCSRHPWQSCCPPPQPYLTINSCSDMSY